MLEIDKQIQDLLEPSLVSQINTTGQRAMIGAEGDLANALLNVYGHARNIPAHLSTGGTYHRTPSIDVEALKATQGHRTMPMTESVLEPLMGFALGAPESKAIAPSLNKVEEVITGVPTNLKTYHGSTKKAGEFVDDASKELWTFEKELPAKRYTRGAVGDVHPIEMKLNNPYVYDASGQPIGRFQAKALKPLKEFNHDAVVLKNVRSPDGSMNNVVIRLGKEK